MVLARIIHRNVRAETLEVLRAKKEGVYFATLPTWSAIDGLTLAGDRRANNSADHNGWNRQSNIARTVRYGSRLFGVCRSRLNTQRRTKPWQKMRASFSAIFSMLTGDGPTWLSIASIVRP
jgi:hypothetical protein